MDIRISSAPVEELEHEGLAVTFYSDERPPRGFCGNVDWRMNGLISRYMSGGVITGKFLERVLFTPYRIGCGKLFLFGMGNREDLTEERMRSLGRDMGAALSAAGICRVACHMTGTFPVPLPPSEMTACALSGLIESYAGVDRQIPVDITCIAHPANLGDEILAGVNRLKGASERASAIRIHQ